MSYLDNASVAAAAGGVVYAFAYIAFTPLFSIMSPPVR